MQLLTVELLKTEYKYKRLIMNLSKLNIEVDIDSNIENIICGPHMWNITDTDFVTITFYDICCNEYNEDELNKILLNFVDEIQKSK